MNKFVLLISIFLVFYASLVFAQNRDTNIINQKIILTDTSANFRSPTGAVLRSLALPGWGQYYVGSYWKAPLFFAGWGTVVFFIIDNHIKYVDAADEYANYTGTNLIEKNYLFRKREYFRDYRDLNALYLLGIYIVSTIDAYVGANMFEFNVDDNLAINYKININGNFEIQFSYKIK